MEQVRDERTYTAQKHHGAADPQFRAVHGH
jgi:hypothetical protein